MEMGNEVVCDGLYCHLCVFFSFLLSLFIFPRSRVD